MTLDKLFNLIALSAMAIVMVLDLMVLPVELHRQMLRKHLLGAGGGREMAFRESGA